MFKLRTSIQAIDPLVGIWCAGKIIERKPGSCHVTWTYYSSKYDRSVDEKLVRYSVPQRCLMWRGAITKEDFPFFGHPSELQRGDLIHDKTRKCDLEVMINDPFLMDHPPNPTMQRNLAGINFGQCVKNSFLVGGDFGEFLQFFNQFAKFAKISSLKVT